MAKTPYQVLEQYVQIVTKAIEDSLGNNEKVASGKLLQSVTVYPVIYGQTISLVVEMDKYWKFVDAGVNGTSRNVGSPYSFKSRNLKEGVMLEHIKNRGYWYATGLKNLQKFRKDKKGRLVARKKQMPADKARKSLAYVLGRGVAKHGFKPTGFLKEAVGDFEADLKRDLLAAVGRDIEVQIETELGLV